MGGEGGCRGADNTDLGFGEFGSNLVVALGMRFRPAKLDCDGTPLDPTEFSAAVSGMR